MSKNTKIMISALVLNLLCLFVRYVWFTFGYPCGYRTYSSAVYRTFELADGWRGEIIKNEVYFSMSFYSGFLIGKLMGSIDLFDGSVFVIAFIGVLGFAFVRRLRSGGGGGLQRSGEVVVDGSSSMIVDRPSPLSANGSWPLRVEVPWSLRVEVPWSLRAERRPLRVASACSRSLRNLRRSNKRSSTSGGMSCSTRGACSGWGVYKT